MKPNMFTILSLLIFQTASVRPDLLKTGLSVGMKFLSYFGYISNGDMKVKSEKEKAEKVESAIMMYQEYNHINATGKLDNKTMTMMEAPRCGNTDKPIVDQMVNPTRRKRFAANSKWEKSVITYKFSNYPRCCLSSEQIEKEFQEAVNIWISAVTPSLQLLKELDDSKPVDIEIEFVNGRHQDNISFAEMNTIAHAFYPVQAGGHALRGDIHFNDEEDWTSGPVTSGQNFLHTACHELGHSLGLEHSMAMDAVMYAMVQKYNPEFDLHLDDVNGIQSLYGVDTASTLRNDDLETAAATNDESFQPHAQVLPNSHAESRILPLTKVLPPHNYQPTATPSSNSNTFYPGVLVVSSADHGKRLKSEANNPRPEITDSEMDCTNYLSSNFIHTNEPSFSCLQFLWNEFYYRKAKGYKLVKISTG